MSPKLMRPLIPISGFVGLIASAIAIGLWTAEQFNGLLVLEILTIPFKLAILAAPLFFFADLSAFLRGRTRLAHGLGLVLVVTTLCAMLVYLPWREVFTHHFGNDVYRWYNSTMPRTPRYDGEFADWEMRWAHKVPHTIEAGLVLAYYGFTITACTLRRWSRIGGGVIAMAGYALLFFVPLWTGLIVWDYDTFLMGIAFDSVSMDLFPTYFWYAGDYSIFFYVFMFIFFGVSMAFIHIKPRSAS